MAVYENSCKELRNPEAQELGEESVLIKLVLPQAAQLSNIFLK